MRFPFVLGGLRWRRASHLQIGLDHLVELPALEPGAVAVRAIVDLNAVFGARQQGQPVQRTVQKRLATGHGARTRQLRTPWSTR